jgi:hypothetical protein
MTVQAPFRAASRLTVPVGVVGLVVVSVTNRRSRWRR